MSAFEQVYESIMKGGSDDLFSSSPPSYDGTRIQKLII